VKVIDLRKENVDYINLGTRKAARNVPIQRILLDDTDLFITLAVAKVHAMSTVSLAIKNQWGCIAARKRFLLHPAFCEILVGLHKLLPKHLVICDGRYVLTFPDA